jgi:exonuclease VII small subunit
MKISDIVLYLLQPANLSDVISASAWGSFVVHTENLEDRIQVLEDGIRDLQQSQADLQRGQADLQRGQGDLQIGQADLQRGQADLQRGQADLQRGQADLQRGLAAVLMAVNELKHAEIPTANISNASLVTSTPQTDTSSRRSSRNLNA